MSNTGPTKKSLGEARRAILKSPVDPRSSHPSREPLPWRGLLTLACAIGVSWLVDDLLYSNAPHLEIVDRIPLSLTAALWVMILPMLRLTPLNDPSSRMKAPWNQEGKRSALLACTILLVGSVGYLGYQISQETERFDISKLVTSTFPELKPYRISGTPNTEIEPYRWALSGELKLQEDTPYLTPLTEAKGRLLVISDQPLDAPLKDQYGHLMGLGNRSELHFISYRNAAGISRKSPLYLFDIRAISWLKTKTLTVILLSLLLLFACWSTSTIDPTNPSKRLFIPNELRNHLADDLTNEWVEDTKELEPPQVQSSSSDSETVID